MVLHCGCTKPQDTDDAELHSNAIPTVRVCDVALPVFFPFLAEDHVPQHRLRGRAVTLFLGLRFCTSECCRLHLKCYGTHAGNRFHLSAKRTSQFKLAGASVQSTTGSRGVRISGSKAGCTMFWGSVRVLATHSICQFLLHFPSRASPCAITFQLDSTKF